MYKNISLYIFFSVLCLAGCQQTEYSDPIHTKAAQKCIASKGSFNFQKNICICNESEDCLPGEFCVDLYPGAGTNSAQICAECTQDEQKCDNNTLFTCKDNKWHENTTNPCPLGCNPEGNACLQCQDNEITCLNPSSDPIYANIVESGIYQCEKGYYTLVESCANGCSSNGNQCKNTDCIDNDQKCSTNEYGQSIILTCQDGSWNNKDASICPQNAPFCLNPQDNENAKCVECTEDICFSISSTNILNGDIDCIFYRSLLLNYMTQIQNLHLAADITSLDDFNAQLDNFFKIHYALSDTSDGTASDGDALSICSPYPISSDESSDLYDFESMSDNPIDSCMDFIRAYMCEGNSIEIDTPPPAPFKSFKIIPATIDNLYSVTIPCNTTTHKINLTDIFTCTRYAEPCTGDNCMPQIFLSKCAPVPEGSQYPNSCEL